MMQIVEIEDRQAARCGLSNGRVAKQAMDPSWRHMATRWYLATAVASQTVKPGIDFSPHGRLSREGLCRW